jgi:GTPase
MEQIKKVQERAFLIGLHTGKEKREEYELTVDELNHLSKTAGAEVLGRFVQRLDKPNSATYIGKGKIQEITEEAERLKVDTLIFNDNLSPTQAKNIAKLTKCNIVDRTELILDIFATHAKTKQAKMQVELALLQYNYSKLRNLWQHFSRIEGGIGLRGPGETQIEIDRREIQKKISILKDRIADIERVSLVKRKKRSSMFNVALVGYTNAGKSTLFNRLTGEKHYVADKLFATLDSTSRHIQINSNDKFILSDTIGFIKKLPHSLVSSFHSTLLEVTESDLLLHVIDASSPDCERLIESVNEVLKEIGASHKEILHIFNKADQLNGIDGKFKRKSLLVRYPNSVFLSAKYDTDFSALLSTIADSLNHMKHEKVLRIPAKLDKLLAFIEEEAEIINKQFDKNRDEHILTVKIDKELAKCVNKQIHDYKYMEYINQ